MRKGERSVNNWEVLTCVICEEIGNLWKLNKVTAASIVIGALRAVSDTCLNTRETYREDREVRKVIVQG